MSQMRISLVLLVLVAVSGAGSADLAQARPDPGARSTVSAHAIERPVQSGRPTGPAEHVSVYPVVGAEAAASVARSEANVAVPRLVASGVAGDRFDWLDAAIGALAAIGTVGISAAALGARRRGRRMQQATLGGAG